MPDFPIDPEVRIRATPSIVLRCTTAAVDFVRKVALSSSDRAWRDLLQNFEAARDEWSAMEAVVKLELLLEAEGLLVEEETAYASCSAEGRSRAALIEFARHPAQFRKDGIPFDPSPMVGRKRRPEGSRMMMRKTSLLLLGAAAGVAVTLIATPPRIVLDLAHAQATTARQ